MQLILIGLGILAGYWTSEWPRRAFPAASRPLKASEMTDLKARRGARLFYPLVTLAGVLSTLAGFMAARSLAPELSERYLAFWGLFFVQGAFGAAVGAFELVTGLSPHLFYFFGASGEQKFYVDRKRAFEVGSWRLASFFVLNLTVFMACRLLEI